MMRRSDKSSEEIEPPAYWGFFARDETGNFHNCEGFLLSLKEVWEN